MIGQPDTYSFFANDLKNHPGQFAKTGRRLLSFLKVLALEAPCLDDRRLLKLAFTSKRPKRICGLMDRTYIVHEAHGPKALEPTRIKSITFFATLDHSKPHYFPPQIRPIDDVEIEYINGPASSQSLSKAKGLRAIGVPKFLGDLPQTRPIDDVEFEYIDGPAPDQKLGLEASAPQRSKVPRPQPVQTNFGYDDEKISTLSANPGPPGQS
ncbi:hypothetical protein TWF173_003483 [Orbilia oligospora]|nr:hypothetical protein TWF173_003483 [Orbilia oligospora]